MKLNAKNVGRIDMAPYNYWYFDFMCFRFLEYGNIILYGSGDVDVLSIRRHFRRVLEREFNEDNKGE